MDARKNYYESQYYTDGNTVRKIKPVPQDTPREEAVYNSPRKAGKSARVNPGIDMVTLLILSVAIIATLYTCIQYLNVQSENTQMNKEIASLESGLTKLQNENNDTLSEIKSNLDLNYIYKVATEELGMVFPDKNQVIPYKSNLNDYVRQYKDIPKKEKETILDSLLK